MATSKRKGVAKATNTKKDTIIAVLSDMHSGGSTALFPGRFWQFKNGNHTPTADQKKMYKHFQDCAAKVRAARQGKRLIVVHDGDAVEGSHHGSLQVVTFLKNEQMEIHVDLMDEFMRSVEFGGADELYYITGTDVHTEDAEDIIGEDLNAVKAPGGLHAWDELQLLVNGVRVAFVHHGPSAGKGANKGNTLRAWLRNQYYDLQAEGKLPPHYIITGHTHDPFWGEFTVRRNGGYFRMQGYICPSWQRRTRYALRVAPLQKSKIGMMYFWITPDGLISEPVEMLMP